MGQRHQVFLIARIATDACGKTPAKTRYRCITAFHHQWCYGRLPLKAARRFLTLVKQNDNAQIIREELRNFGKAPSDIPCPYSLFLLASAWTVDLTPGEEYSDSSGFSLPVDMGSSEGDNNDGITVVDVTDPENASYCFVSVGQRTRNRWGSKLTDEGIPYFTPINAKRYVRVYYPEAGDKNIGGEILSAEAKEQNSLTEEDVLKTIASLDDVPLVTIDKLADAWPREYRRTNTLATPIQQEIVPKVPCLADLSVEPAVNYALEVGQVETLELLLDMPGKAALIKDTLQKRISLPDDAIALVAKIISQETQKSKELDLSQWTLTSEQVVKLVSQSKNIKSLRLSHNHHVTKTTVLEVLSARSVTLRKLVLLDTAVTNSDMDELLSENPKLFYSFEAIVHTSFLRGIKTRAGVFTHITSEGDYDSAVSLPYFTPGQVVQVLTDLLGLADQPYPDLASGFAVQAAYASELRKEGCPWTERVVPIYAERSSPSLNTGWTFVWTFPSNYCRDPNIKRYGFVRPREGDDLNSGEINDGGEFNGSDASPSSITHDIYDLKSFIDILVSEGRPAPSPTALEKLSGPLSARFTLLTQQDLATVSKLWK